MAVVAPFTFYSDSRAVMDLLSLIILASIGWWWYSATRRRDRILGLLRGWCRQRQLVLLDDTVVWRGWRRDQEDARRAVLAWHWFYGFEVSHNGVERIKGNVLMQSGEQGRVWISVEDNGQQYYEQSDTEAD